MEKIAWLQLQGREDNNEGEVLGDLSDSADWI